jgi:hypothetical protein
MTILRYLLVNDPKRSCRRYTKGFYLKYDWYLQHPGNPGRVDYNHDAVLESSLLASLTGALVPVSMATPESFPVQHFKII